MALSPPNEGLDFQRPPGWRFAFQGVNLRDVPDALPPTKFASAKNIRATPTQGVQTRPGYTLLFSTGGLSVTDLKTYALISASSTFVPRFLARDSHNQIWLDNGTLVATMFTTASNFWLGVTMLPFRPSESPQTWMYIASAEDYQKVSAPDALTGLTTAYKVGIAEPPTAVDAGVAAAPYTNFSALAASWAAAGVMGGPSDTNRDTATAGVVLQDTASASRYSVQVTAPPTASFQIGELIAFSGTQFVIQDVIPKIPSGLTIRAIRYDSGATGRCTIVPSQMPLSGAASGTEDPLAGLRRGGLVQISGSEIAMILDTAVGPEGSVCFETSTTGSYTAGAALAGIPAIVVGGIVPVAGQSITSPVILSSSTGTGIASASQALASSPFGSQMGSSGLFPQTEDYFHISLKIQDPTLLVEMKVIFNVDPTVDYAHNVYYYSVQPSLFTGVTAATQTQLQAEQSSLTQTTLPDGTPLPQQAPAGTGQWTEVMVPVSALLRIGDDANLSLAQCNGVQVLFNVTGATTIEWGGLWVGGGYAADTGADGVEYRYRMAPRNSSTGVKGNSTPPMRYGVRPRRQQVAVSIPSAAYDPQIDVWDVERYGGSVTTYRYIGSVNISATQFLDDFSDAAAEAGNLMEVDNFEPWPSIDVPFRVNASAATITVVGTKIVISGFTTWPVTIDRWLPGTLIQLGGQSAYTLRQRPTKLSGSSYLFDIEECAGPDVTITPAYFWVLEPKVARQPQNYTFGPDVNGTFFAVGDHLRPGTLSYSKSFNPDSAPDKYNLDLCPPSEILITGFIKGGVALVASLKRWWALYPQFGNAAQRYNPVEQSVGRGIAAPFGYCTDGATVWFWAKDGICSSDGGPHTSLTDADLYNLFPHEGVAGANVTRNGVTYYAPDYSNSGTFRLAKVNTYLFADYQDAGGIQRTLVYDFRTGGWSQDIYADQITTHMHVGEEAPPVCLLADTAGKVYQELDCAGDNSQKIPCLVATFEWDGGDLRASPLFGDSYLDCVPQSVITAQPVSQGNPICPPTTITASGSRTLAVVSVAGGELQKFLGCVYTWSD